MDDSIAIKTELFEHREVKPNFINPCCFGGDFALWLIEKLASLRVRGFAFSQPIQEDYGWGFWAYRERDRFLGSTVICRGGAAGGTCEMGGFGLQAERHIKAVPQDGFGKCFSRVARAHLEYAQVRKCHSGRGSRDIHKLVVTPIAAKQ
jgi:hypothetical protein